MALSVLQFQTQTSTVHRCAEAANSSMHEAAARGRCGGNVSRATAMEVDAVGVARRGRKEILVQGRSRRVSRTL